MAKLLLDTSTNVAAGATVFAASRVRDEKGLWQIFIEAGSATSIKVSLYGRAAPAAPWHPIIEEDSSDQVVNNTNATLVDIFPEMTAEVSANGAGVDIKAWLVD